MRRRNKIWRKLFVIASGFVNWHEQILRRVESQSQLNNKQNTFNGIMFNYWIHFEVLIN